MKILLESMLYQGDMPQELQQEFLKDMNHEIDRLTGIVTDLLSLTQMDSHTMTLKKESVDLTELTHETERLLRPMAEKRHQSLTADVAPNVWTEGDRNKLAQILYNLTDNALKYTPDYGKVHIMLDMDGSHPRWTVSDNGVGIPEEDQKHIFERFYRVDKARSRDTGGTGLGLSIANELAERLQAHLEVESVVGEGTLMRVILPLEVSANENE